MNNYQTFFYHSIYPAEICQVLLQIYATLDLSAPLLPVSEALDWKCHVEYIWTYSHCFHKRSRGSSFHRSTGNLWLPLDSKSLHPLVPSLGPTKYFDTQRFVELWSLKDQRDRIGGWVLVLHAANTYLISRITKTLWSAARSYP